MDGIDKRFLPSDLVGLQRTSVDACVSHAQHDRGLRLCGRYETRKRSQAEQSGPHGERIPRSPAEQYARRPLAVGGRGLSLLSGAGEVRHDPQESLDDHQLAAMVHFVLLGA